ncbi:MAG: DUF4159 domain-containing protein [Gemmatimonadaceae bacterium]
MRGRRGVLTRSVIASCLLVLLLPALANAQRRGRGGFGGGCSWNSYDVQADRYWDNPAKKNIPYDGRLIIARIWYSGFYAFCAASAPYSDELSVGWAHDFPHPEENLAQMVNALSTVRAYNGGGNIFKFDDPALLRFPIAYLTEPGGWVVSPAEAAGARNYLLKGGFLIIDDWRGPDASERTWTALKTIFPNLTPKRIPDNHVLFNSFFQIKNASTMLRNQNGGYGNAEYWGVFEDNDVNKRLMVICDVNADIKDYWVWSATGRDPIDTSNEAYKLGINYLVYALMH